MSARGPVRQLFSRARRAFRVLKGPGVLMAWQLAPVQVAPDSTGTLRVSLAYGSGAYEHFVPACDGPASYLPVDTRSIGGTVEFWANDKVRVSALGGTLRAETTAEQGRGGSGGYFGGAMAVEGDIVGVGLGLMSLNDPTQDDSSNVPLAYLRFGDLGQVHARGELIGTGPAVGSVGLARAGVAFNQGRRAGARWFAGVETERVYGIGEEGGAHASGPFMELWLPVSRGFELGLGANKHFGEEHPDHALWVGGALSLGGGFGG